MPRLVRSAACELRSRVFDSARWAAYQPRHDDILIATYSKCGTTWMQRIMSMLVFTNHEPRSIWELSPWPDARFGPPIDALWEMAEAQRHRRFFKSHLPLSALPLYDDVKYVHVARDGRDACMSLHNHMRGFTPEAIAMLNEISRNDPQFGDDYPPAPEDPGVFFHEWITHSDRAGGPELSFFGMERSFWKERQRPNVLLVHYNDLKADREEEMKRIARFLDIEIPDTLWPKLVEGAGFEAMKRDGEALMGPIAHMLWDDGPKRFLNKGTNGRWRDVVAPEDLARYEEMVKSEVSPALARWIEHGRRVAGDPRDLED